MGLIDSFLSKAKGVIGKVAGAVTKALPIAKGVIGKVSSLVNNPTVQGLSKGVLGKVVGGIQSALPIAQSIISKAEPAVKTIDQAAKASTLGEAVKYAKGLLPANLRLNF